MKINQEVQLDFSDVLIKPMRSTITSRQDVCLERNFQFHQATGTWTGIPIILSNMDKIGTLESFEIAHKYKVITALVKHYTPLEVISWLSYKDLPPEATEYLAFSVGISARDKELFKRGELRELLNKVRFLNIDIANGYIADLIPFCKMARHYAYDSTVIIVGNVVTPEVAQDLITGGLADIVKIGLGSGAVCTTLEITGVGRPQLSAILDCGFHVHHYKHARICSDGGIQTIGDFAKAFVADADFVMAGSIFAPYSPHAELVHAPSGLKHVRFHGMASEEAMITNYGAVPDYKTSEGREVIVESKGSLDDIIKRILGGLRSTAAYIGAETLKEFPKKGSFYLVNNQLNTSLVRH